MKTNTTTATNYTAEELENILTLPSIATAHKLKNLASKSAEPFVLRLRSAWYNDHKADLLQDINEEIDHYQSIHDEAEEFTAELRKIAKRIRTDEADRLEAWEEAEAQAEIMRRATDHIVDLERATATTYSDRKDLEHDGALMLCTIYAIRRVTADFTANYPRVNALALMGKLAPKDRDREQAETEAEAEEIADYRNTLGAIGNSINAKRGANAHNRTTTTKQLLTAEQVTEYVATYGGIGKEYKHRTDKGNTQYIEYKQYKKQPQGFYLITEAKTTAPHISYEYFTEDMGDLLQTLIVSNNGINAIENQQAQDNLYRLMQSANLTDRGQRFILHFMDNTSANAGQKAVNEYYRTQGAKATRKGAEECRFLAMRKNAFERKDVGIYSADNQKKTLQRIRQRLADHKTERRTLTATELFSYDIAYCMRNYEPSATPEAEQRADLIAWAEQTAPSNTESIIEWQSRAERGQSRARARAKARENESKSTIDNATVYTRLTDFHNLKRYYIKHTPHKSKGAFKDAKESALILAPLFTFNYSTIADEIADLDRTNTERAKAQTELDKARAEAERNGVRTDFDTTFEQWHSYTDKQKALWQAFIEAHSKL